MSTREIIKSNLEGAYKHLNAISVKGAENCRAIANIATALNNVYQLTQSKDVEYADEKLSEKEEKVEENHDNDTEDR